ncbi:acyltransferase family protein [Paenibacillus methanolicus]|uniref:Peptidoglycan/LPS O-acetylase OafA/YrhL n=1 Tax=Paenibacillus methanolicus TaxID=582686 RepID=A0A5S5C5T2_9BACL|nr:acyltransferase [Paenibacillus methanolicus]TYP74694.1 peptidoglycan/LPS O-acetylase OafA/YrhL [Paenibacillus methanolicus]
MNSDRLRLSWIDAIRGYAAIAVVIYHLWEINSRFLHFEAGTTLQRVLEFFIRDGLDIGKIGVVMFFAVSGFVIPYSLLKTKEFNLLKFVSSRFFRLYPLYWLSIILALVVMGTKFGGFQIAANATMFQSFIGVEDMLGVYWTLQIELIFYILCALYFLLGIIQKSKSILLNMYFWLIASLMLAAARYVTEINLPVALTLALSVMFFGMAWRKLKQNEGTIQVRSVYIWMASFALFMFPISYLAYADEWLQYAMSYIVALVIFLAFSKASQKEFKISSYFGKISYSVYLLHPVIALPMFNAIMKTAWGQSLGLYGVIILCLVAVVIASSITFRFIEQPCVDYGRKVTNKLIDQFTRRRKRGIKTDPSEAPSTII